MTNILHLIPTLEGGGAERQLSMLAAEQSRRGWCVHVGIRRGGVHEELLRSTGVTIHSLGDHRIVNPLLLVSIDALIKKIKPDVVQTWLPQMDIVGGIAALWNSVPWIISERASKLAYQGVPLRTGLRCRLAQYASAIVANSSNGAVYWGEILNGAVPVSTIANAVNVEAIRNAANIGCENSNLKDGMKYLLVVGRLVPEKGLESIMQAVHLVPEKNNIRISIIGDGPLRKDIEVGIRDAELGDRITLQPYNSTWWGLFKSASALVSMSRFEGQPNVVLETMAAGCPLIVSDIPEHREFLDDDSAIFVPLDNPVALAEAIVSLLSDKASALQRTERALMRVNNLTVQAATDAYESTYRKVMSGRVR